MEVQEQLKQTDAERQKTVAEFKQLHQFLEEQERLLLAQLEELDKEIVKSRDEYLAKLSEEISSLGELISEMEEKCREPTSEFLQDIRSTLNRCEREKFQDPGVFASGFKRRIWESLLTSSFLESVMKQFKDTLSAGQHLNEAMVTLNPDTAHPILILSEDQKSVRCGDTQQNLPDNPERFDSYSFVLGCEGFTSGQHCWEMELEGKWAVGVVRESVRRKGRIAHNPEQGIWGVVLNKGAYSAFTDPITPLSLRKPPTRIRVYLDYAGGQVAFFDADHEVPIFTFPPASFSGERIHPWFWAGEGSQLRLCPRDTKSSIPLAPCEMGSSSP
uniref:B30.2/SPRY domain-containing protein n=1 Tax=Sphenodon punctatus TaxID=8508 RepID=A0A8D0L9A5_SPHPU